MEEGPGDISRLLERWSGGDRAAFEELIPVVYDELRRLASHYLQTEREGHTLQSTALVHEAYVRLVHARNLHWQGRAHFFAVAAQSMRRILVDHARQRQAGKRGSGARKAPFEEALTVPVQQGLDVAALDESLDHLAAFDPRKSRVVELRFFGGLSTEEISEVLGISAAAVRNDWVVAKAWLYRDLECEQTSHKETEE
jgi:RNA polymerase sigma-70 factor (ECF subfamily)